MSKIFFTILLFPIFASSKPQLSKSFRPWWAEGSAEYGIFHSIGNFNSEGKAESLPSANSFWETSQFKFDGRYVYSSTLALTAGINRAHSQANVGTATKSAENFQTLSGGVEHRFMADRIELIFEGVGNISFYQVNTNSSSPLVGDGAHSLGGNLWLSQKMNGLQWLGKVGYLYRTDGLSSLLPYMLAINWTTGALVLGASIEGAWSTGSDAEEEVDRKAFLNKCCAGSYNFRSPNPTSNFTDFYGKWNVTNQFSFYGGIGNSVMGRNFSDGSRFYLGIDVTWQVYQMPTQDRPLRNAIGKPTKQPPKDDKNPLYLEEDYNQEL